MLHDEVETPPDVINTVIVEYWYQKKGNYIQLGAIVSQILIN